MVKLDDYVLDSLMRDLVGHDRRPACFLVYLWLAGEQQRRKPLAGDPNVQKQSVNVNSLTLALTGGVYTRWH